jgi:hypothetical protein
MDEKTIERKVKEYAISKGWLVYKFTSPAHNGVPDRIFISPLGKLIFIEFKTPKGCLSPVQQREVVKLRKQRQTVLVVSSVGHGLMMIDNINKVV